MKQLDFRDEYKAKQPGCGSQKNENRQGIHEDVTSNNFNNCYFVTIVK